MLRTELGLPKDVDLSYADDLPDEVVSQLSEPLRSMLRARRKPCTLLAPAKESSIILQSRRRGRPRNTVIQGKLLEEIAKAECKLRNLRRRLAAVQNSGEKDLRA